MTTDLSPSPSILNDLADLGSRIGALRSLGAGFAAALCAETIVPEDVALLRDGYASSLVELQRKISSELGGRVDQVAAEEAIARGHRAAGEPAPPLATRSVDSGPGAGAAAAA